MIQLHYYTAKILPFQPEHEFIKVEKVPILSEGEIMPLALPDLPVISPTRYKVTINVEVDDSSYRYRALMRKPQLILKFSLPEYIDFPVGTWCVYQNETYRLNSEKNLKKNGKRNITYDMTLGGDEDKLGLYKFRNSVDGRLKFSMCAKPHELVEEIVKNLNAREGADVWSVGTPVIESTEKTVEFNHCYIDAALQSIADTFETEWEIVNRTIYLRKVEYNKDNPLPLSYGRGNGFVPGLGRTTDLDEAPIKRIYTQGGTRNVDRSKYGGEGSMFPEYATSSAELLLPPSQTLEYEGRTYKTDAQGYYVERIDKISKAVKEDSLDCSEIYPSRVGTVGTVITVKTEKHFYDFVDTSIPETLNYNDCIIEGETPTIIFQSGMLAGKEFEFRYRHDERRFEIVPQEIDGIIMPDPDSGYMPVTGNEYAVFGIMLPKQYFFDNSTKTGASWDMFREAAKKLYEREDAKFTFKGDLQGLWAKRNWLNIGGKLVVGGYILFTDDQFAIDGVKIRITGIKDYVNTPYAPTLEISNSVSGSTVRSELAKIENTEVVIGDKTDSLLQFTKRRFRDARETIEMLEDAMLDNFTNSISPVAVQTMAALIGDESLQYRFVSSKSNLTQVVFPITYNQETKKLHCPHGYLQHMTLGITSVSSTHADSEYKCWEVEEFNSPVLNEEAQKYYLYAIVSKDNTDAVGRFVLSTNSLPFIGTGSIGDIPLGGKYCLLVGVLNSEYDGERSFVSLYGFTEILPGRITTDKIVSSDGESFLDLANGIMKLGDCLAYNEDGKKQLFLKFLLAENANLAGWIFRNNRLESQNGSLYLDGVKGEVNIGGVIRFATAAQGKLTDANLIWLPNTTETKTVTVLYEREHLGKIIKCFNSNPFGGHNWRIALREYTFHNNSGSGDIISGNGYVHELYDAIVRPQETVEIAYLEKPYTGGGGAGSFAGRWELVGRFSQELFINNTDIGRFPRMLAIGRLVYNNGNPYISGDWWNGKPITTKLTPSRLGTGKYRIAFAPSDIPSGYKVLVSGYGAIAGGSNSIKAGVWETASDHFDVYTSDDASNNDGSFDFMIFAPNWWYNLSEE